MQEEPKSPGHFGHLCRGDIKALMHLWRIQGRFRFSLEGDFAGLLAI